MGVGAGTYMGWASLLGISQETTWGTFVTSTTNIEFLSEGFKNEIEEKKIEQINSTRFIKKRLTGNESISGNLETYLNVAADGLIYCLKNAMGGTVSSLTIAAGCMGHTFYSGDMESNQSSAGAANIKGLSVAVRRGPTNVWNYSGMRVNTLTLKGEVGNPVSMSLEMIGKGCSISATLPSVAISDVKPVNFTGITIKTGATISACTAEDFTSFEFTINNNLASDVRSLGSRNIVALPVQRQDINLKLGQRFDTTSAYDRFLANTSMAVEITLDTGVTIGVAGTTMAMIISIPEVYYNSNTPNVGDVGVLKQDLNLTAIYSSATSYLCQILVRNGTANY